MRIWSPQPGFTCQPRSEPEESHNPDVSLNIVADLVREAAHALTGSRSDYDPLLDFIGDAHFVLLGEASHGTHEFYRERAKITKRLIQEKGFNAIAVEADWPDSWRVNRCVQGLYRGRKL